MRHGSDDNFAPGMLFTRVEKLTIVGAALVLTAFAVGLNLFVLVSIAMEVL